MIPTFEEQRPPLKRAKILDSKTTHNADASQMYSTFQQQAASAAAAAAAAEETAKKNVVPTSAADVRNSAGARAQPHDQDAPMEDAPQQPPPESLDPPTEKLDSNAYSRQIYAIGESAMLKLRKASVLISGVGACGVEVAKNLILGGVRRVGIHDDAPLEWGDLAATYYATAANVGENRARVCFRQLEELNDSVQCVQHTGKLTAELVAQYDLTILTDAPFDRQCEVNDWARRAKRAFVSADSRGLFGFIFADLGAEFQVDDTNGEAVRECLIEYVDRATGNVHTLEGAHHGLEDGDFVKFVEVGGMSELNHAEPMEITVVKPNIFNVGKIPENFGIYVEGGRARQVKRPKLLQFEMLKDALENPKFVIWDFAHFDAPAHLHALWRALYAFEKRHARKPKVRNDADVQLLRDEISAFISADEIPEFWIQSFSYQARGQLQPVTSIIGGIAAQEVLKAITHHTMPQQQFLYTHHLEVLPGDYSTFDNSKLTAADCEPKSNRYDAAAAIFGWEFQKALAAQRWFLVGAGAIGCELLKNFAMLGLATGADGMLKVTDMDQIELSNLNRQFLFRRRDIGAKKSEVAAAAARQFNPQLRIEALTERVAEDTEHVFNDDFFANLTGVANALDNLEARRYVDRRCVFYELPLLESGTSGPKGNTQVVYPHLTESYSSTNDPPEKDIPICTLKHFPYEIQHTIQWARGQFEDLFTHPAEKVNQYLAEPRVFLERLDQVNEGDRIRDLKCLKQLLIDERPKTSADCVRWARNLFDHHFGNEITQLLHNFPADQLTSSGLKFWSGTKRCPHALEFDADDRFHFDFVYSASILRAQQYALAPIEDAAEVARLARAHQPPKFVPRTGVKIAVTDAEAKDEGAANEIDESDAETLIDDLKLRLARLQLGATAALRVIDFEKDDDANHHVEFVCAASNLRAANYEIPQADAMKTKQIAGRIIPALATTTAIVAGLVALELLKCVEADGKRARTPLDRFRCAFLNLAGPFYTFCEPGAAPIRRYGDTPFTLWDRLEIRGPKTLRQLIDWVKEKTGLEVSMLSAGVSLIYAFFQPPAKVAERMAKNAVDVVVEVTRKPIPPHQKSLVFDAATTNSEDEDVEIPFIKYYV